MFSREEGGGCTWCLTDDVNVCLSGGHEEGKRSAPNSKSWHKGEEEGAKVVDRVRWKRPRKEEKQEDGKVVSAAPFVFFLQKRGSRCLFRFCYSCCWGFWMPSSVHRPTPIPD